MSPPWVARPLRIGLEPGYDGGRVGAWLLDVPGAFGWARNRDAAISQSTGFAGWWREWLARHGDAWPNDPLGSPEVVEEVAPTVVDGYERNALFARDREPVRHDELDAAIRRLDYARLDLMALVDRVRRLGGEGERPGLDVLRHLADVEVWLGSRLDPQARYAGRLDEPDPRAHLDATREWAVDNLRRLHAVDPEAQRTDGKGELWTFGKVMRRYVYHSVDHLRELDRRLARAENRVGRLRWSVDHLQDVAPLVRLLRAVGWDRRTRDVPKLQRAIDRSQTMVGAWDGDELVAFARDVGDEVFNAVISMVIVDPRWQDLGLARRLIETLMADRPNVRFTLNAAAGIGEYYERFGFQRDPSAMVRPRPPGA